MKIVAVKDKEEMGLKAAQLIIEAVRQKPDAVLGLATGDTPVGTYQALVRDHREHGTSYRRVRTVNLDEYVGIDAADPNSYHAYMENHLFKYIDLPEDQHFLPDGMTASDEECARYDRLIDKLGGVDLQLLGIGRNGHIGFNEPGTPLSIGTHIVELTESTRKANARFFGSIDKVPTKAVTMGIGTILKSRKIVLIASGSAKAEAMKQLVHATAPDTHFAASALVLHKDVTVIADEQALALIDTHKE